MVSGNAHLAGIDTDHSPGLSSPGRLFSLRHSL